MRSLEVMIDTGEEEKRRRLKTRKKGEEKLRTREVR